LGQMKKIQLRKMKGSDGREAYTIELIKITDSQADDSCTIDGTGTAIQKGKKKKKRERERETETERESELMIVILMRM
jgi:hypothetical protein